MLAWARRLARDMHTFPEVYTGREENAVPLQKIEFMIDQSPSDPRKEWECVSVIACKPLRRYTLGEEVIHDDTKAFIRHLPKGSIALPLFFRENGDVSLAVKPFFPDQEPVGVVYATPKAITHIYGNNSAASRKLARASLAGELETYAQYVNGECYGMRTIDEDGSVDEVYGFYGSNVFANGMSGNVADEDMHVLKQAVQDSGFMMGSLAQFEADTAERLARQAARARAAARPRAR